MSKCVKALLDTGWSSGLLPHAVSLSPCFPSLYCTNIVKNDLNKLLNLCTFIISCFCGSLRVQVSVPGVFNICTATEIHVTASQILCKTSVYVCVLYLCVQWWQPRLPAPLPSPRRCEQWVGTRRPAQGKVLWRWTVERWSPPPPWSIAEGPCCPSGRRSGSLVKDRRRNRRRRMTVEKSVWNSCVCVCVWKDVCVCFLWPTLDHRAHRNQRQHNVSWKKAWKHNHTMARTTQPHFRRNTNKQTHFSAVPENVLLCSEEVWSMQLLCC